MHSLTNRVLAPCLAVLLAVGLIDMPTSAVFAYTGSQTLRDESGGCCVTGPWVGSTSPWWHDTSPNGYDSNAAVSVPNVGDQIRYYPYPNPAGIMMCVVIHIPNIVSANNHVYFHTFHDYTTANQDSAVFEQDVRGYWDNYIRSSPWHYSDSVGIDDLGYATPGYDWAADVVSFHFDSSTNYTTCSF